MNKNLWIYALALTLILLPANAEDTKLSPLKNHLNLNEIALNTEPDTNEKKFIPVFDLKGGVEKIESNSKTEETVAHKWLNGDYATGKWFGIRNVLENHGITVTSSMMYDPFGKTRGGMANQVKTGSYSLFNLSVTADTEKMGLWKGGTFYTLYQNKRGGGLAGAGGMGDYQIFDNYDFREMNQISEVWYQQRFKDKVRLKFGKQDANMDFCSLGKGFDFLNLSFSVIPTVPLPTYPDQSFGFLAEVSPAKWVSLKNGIYSKYNVPFNISEIELRPSIKKMPGKYMLGVWELSDSNGMDVAGGMDSNGNIYYNNFNRNFGFYASFEQIIYKEKKDDDCDMQGLAVFGQFGISPSNRNDMSRYTGGGLHYRGPFTKRDKDIAGIGVASGNFASRLGDITSQIGDETAIEAFYRVQITPWFYLQPDIQFILNPGGLYTNSVAFGIRSFISF